MAEVHRPQDQPADLQSGAPEMLVQHLTLAVGDDMAFGHSLNRVSGTLKNGTRTEYWVRWTGCFQKIDGNWLIVHDQVSVPVDMESGRASLNLQP
jgi:ketosteroid isomerase-like protein